MPRSYFNWTFTDVVKFLKNHGYLFTNKVGGSHYYYIRRRPGGARLVHVPFHGQKAIKPRTLKSIIVQSDISKEEWLGIKKKKQKR